MDFGYQNSFSLPSNSSNSEMEYDHLTSIRQQSVFLGIFSGLIVSVSGNFLKINKIVCNNALS